jgi:hypothetical protein
MAKVTPRRRALRPPYVVSIASALCAVAVPGASPEGAPRQGPARHCPQTVPAAGSRCAVPSQRCTYNRCYGAPSHFATCDARSRVWRLSVRTCNPPAQELVAPAPPAADEDADGE